MQRHIPQLDGIVEADGTDDDADDGNHDDDGGDDDDKPAAKDDDDDELNSDLDDDDEVPESDHLVLCQFEKVRARVDELLLTGCESCLVAHEPSTQVIRIKNKRKCNLKDGVMRLNGRDFLFSKANGEFEF